MTDRLCAIMRAPGMSHVLRYIPDFDLYKLHEVLRLALWEESERGLVLEMDVVHAGRHVCSIQLEGVRDLHLPVLVESMPSFSELEVEDVSGRGLEGISYQLQDVGASGSFSWFCRRFRFSKLALSSESALPQVIWTADEQSV